MTQLGCPSSMGIAIYPRGGRGEAIAVANKLSAVDWNRKLDSVSESTVVFATAQNKNCCQGLSTVDAWSHEMHIFRDKVKVWQGPINRITDDNGSGLFTIEAQDVMSWLERRILHAGYSYAGRSTDLTEIAQEVIRVGFTRDDPNVSRWTKILSTAGVRQERIVDPESKIVLDDIQDMADQGLNYTVVGRNIFLFGDSISIGDLGVLNDSMFTASAPITREGNLTLTSATVVGSNDVVGTYGGVNAKYGLHEILLSVNDIADRISAESIARASVMGMVPPPVIVNTDSAGILRPNVNFDIMELVPGVTATYGAKGNCIELQQRLRLEEIQVSWRNNSEAVQPVFAPIMGISR